MLGAASARVSTVVGGACDRSNMRVTAEMIERIPRGNLRVRRADFAAVWIEAERICDNHLGPPDGRYFAAVAVTCRWQACAIVPGLRGSVEPARAPITRTAAAAHEELIERETQEAEIWLAQFPQGAEGRPGWLEGINATLSWTWRGVDTPPLHVSHADAG